MNDAIFVGEAERIRDVTAVLEHGFERQAVFGNELEERTAVDELHDDERVPANFADLVNRADVRMIERRSGPRLFQQLHGGKFPGRILQTLDRDGAMQPRIVRAVHDAHGARSESRLDAVVAEQLADHGSCPWELVMLPTRTLLRFVPGAALC